MPALSANPAVADRAAPEPLATLVEIVAALDGAGVRYCHWKSNHHLAHALAGVEDFDVLVAKEQFGTFAEILLARGFKLAESVSSRDQPGVFHFLGSDAAVGTLINVHAYTRILSGDHVAKSYALGIESLLLGERRRIAGVPVPTAAAEMVVFVLRLAIKLGHLIDRRLLARSRDALAAEFRWLHRDYDPARSTALLAAHLPEVPVAAYAAVVDALDQGTDPLRLGGLARRLRRSLRQRRRFGWAIRTTRAATTIAKMVHNRLWRRQRHMTLQAGGAIVALVGPQASGKSTLATAIRGWLGRELRVRYVHVGKPPSTWLTILPNLLLPWARRLLRRQTTREVDRQIDADPTAAVPLIYVLRKLLLAHDRMVLLRRVFRASRAGEIVLCDRYPSDTVGAIDGASFTDESLSAARGLKRRLMLWERRIYRAVEPPDIVVALSVPVDVAVVRNVERDKPDAQDEDYVRQRHGMRLQPTFERSQVIALHTGAPLASTLLEVKQRLWCLL